MITIGIFLASCVNSVLLTYSSGELQWRLAFGVQIIPALFLIIIIALLPFSPRWLLLKGTFLILFVDLICGVGFTLVWFGLVWFGLVWFGLVWFGLVWFGLVWVGLACVGVECLRRVWFGSA